VRQEDSFDRERQELAQRALHSFFIQTIFPRQESKTVGFQIEGIPAYERATRVQLRG